MKRLIIYLLSIFAAISAVAQINVSGKVIDKVNNVPLTGASVIVKGTDGKIKKFTSSKANGSFEISVPSVDDCRLEV